MTEEKTTPDVKAPWGLRWRASVWMITLVVATCIMTDLTVYSLIIPVIPYRLEELGYSDVASLTGYLLFGYSASILVSTPLIAFLSEAYKERKITLLIGLAVLLGSQIMFMEAPTYAVMVVARVLQGVSSSVVWIVSLAMLCDTVPESRVGQQLGIALSGMSIGLVIGPPIGAALYTSFGFRGPFVFGIAFCLLDAVGRLLIIERKHALQYGYDPALIVTSTTPDSGEGSTGDVNRQSRTEGVEPAPDVPQSAGRLSSIQILIKLSRSPRAMIAFFLSFLYGVIFTAQEPTLPLRLQDVYGFTSFQVGMLYVGACVPTLVSGPIAGWISDKHGTEWVTFVCIILSLPWWVLLIIRGPLALFIACLILSTFFMAAVIAPVTSELAAVARNSEGIGYAHVFGSFNLAYGAGSTIGPIIGGVLYDRTPNGAGWTAICLLMAGLILVALLGSVQWAGERPLIPRLKKMLAKDRDTGQ